MKFIKDILGEICLYLDYRDMISLSSCCSQYLNDILLDRNEEIFYKVYSLNYTNLWYDKDIIYHNKLKTLFLCKLREYIDTYNMKEEIQKCYSINRKVSTIVYCISKCFDNDNHIYNCDGDEGKLHLNGRSMDELKDIGFELVKEKKMLIEIYNKKNLQITKYLYDKYKYKVNDVWKFRCNIAITLINTRITKIDLKLINYINKNN